MSRHQPRDTVYLADGREALYVGYIGGSHVVMPIVEHDDGPVQSDYPESHNVVFTEPPADKYHAEAAAAKKELDTARTELQKVQTELRQARADRNGLLAEISKHPDLAPIAEFMAGTLTHAALLPASYYGSEIKVVTIGEAIEPRTEIEKRSGEVRLLSLYGGWTGIKGTSSWGREDYRWRLNEYRDGSGATQVCILGTSEANVLERLQVYLDGQWAKVGVHSENTLIGWARGAIRLGLTVPASMRTKVEAEDAKAVEHAKKQAVDSLAHAEKQLAQAREKAIELGVVS
jgi:hypothetical protein